MSDEKEDRLEDADSGTAVEERVRIKRPKPYKVILLNDNYTTMDFVVSILERIFKKSPAEAVRVMLQVHQAGFGVCGNYPKQIAESKVKAVHDEAQGAGYPLRCTMEET